MSIVLQGSTSGSITLQEPAVAGSTVLDLPATTGTVALTSQLPTAPSAVGQIPFSTDGSTYTPTAKIVNTTALTPTSGSNAEFTNIPSWVKRITVIYSNLSTTGSQNYLVQLGTGSTTYTTSGYTSTQTTLIGGVSLGTNTSGFPTTNPSGGGASCSGHCFITNITGNTWVFTSSVAEQGSRVFIVQGTVALSAVLTAVRVNVSTDTFDAGSINIFYE